MTKNRHHICIPHRSHMHPLALLPMSAAATTALRDLHRHFKGPSVAPHLPTTVGPLTGFPNGQKRASEAAAQATTKTTTTAESSAARPRLLALEPSLSAPRAIPHGVPPHWPATPIPYVLESPFQILLQSSPAHPSLHPPFPVPRLMCLRGGGQPHQARRMMPTLLLWPMASVMELICLHIRAGLGVCIMRL